MAVLIPTLHTDVDEWITVSRKKETIRRIPIDPELNSGCHLELTYEGRKLGRRCKMYSKTQECIESPVTCLPPWIRPMVYDTLDLVEGSITESDKDPHCVALCFTSNPMERTYKVSKRSGWLFYLAGQDSTEYTVDLSEYKKYCSVEKCVMFVDPVVVLN